jgi:hypothetical protein
MLIPLCLATEDEVVAVVGQLEVCAALARRMLEKGRRRGR